MSSSRIRQSKGVGIVLAAVLLWPNTPVRSYERVQDQSPGRTHTLTCGGERTLAKAIKSLKPGDTLLVSGDCHENLVIGQEVHRVTLDGQGTASLTGDSTATTLTILGTGITIRGFIISGGNPQAINVQDGGTAVIDGNTIQNADRNGIGVFRSSTADIVNNTIQDNGLAGITVQSSSSARIGWVGPPNNRVKAPNTIQGNGTQGIQVFRGSSAQIFANSILNNLSHGVFVERSAQAEIAGNLISGNGGDGIRGQKNSSVEIGTDDTGSTPAFDDDTNSGVNKQYGVRCMLGGFVDGVLGALTGGLGPKSVTEGCLDSL